MGSVKILHKLKVGLPQAVIQIKIVTINLISQTNQK
jgi:hypothetical protein